MTEEYKIPEQTKAIHTELTALEDVRDCYIKRPFGFKKAVKAAGKLHDKQIEFWGKVHKLYPELRTKELSYKPTKGVIIVTCSEED